MATDTKDAPTAPTQRERPPNVRRPGGGFQTRDARKPSRGGRRSGRSR